MDDSTHGIEASQDHDDKEKREETREKRGERREKTEDRRQTPRGRQRSPNEAARGGPTLSLAMPPGAGTSGGLKGSEKRAEKRKKREEKREKIDFCCFSRNAEGVLLKDAFEFSSPDGSRWRPQSEKAGFSQEFLRKKPLIS